MCNSFFEEAAQILYKNEEKTAKNYLYSSYQTQMLKT